MLQYMSIFLLATAISEFCMWIGIPDWQLPVEVIQAFL